MGTKNKPTSLKKRDFTNWVRRIYYICIYYYYIYVIDFH